MIDYTLTSLPNGLRVVHHPDYSAHHVAVNLLYNVGSRDESPELTGMAHLFEHLMFGGSPNVPDFDSTLEMAGGSNNAWTSNDFTNFYDIIPRENIATAFWAESDRMLSLSFNPRSLEVQRKVVIEEFKQTCINRPYGDLGHLLRSLLYTRHPYRYPTIGRDISHIERVTMDDVRRWFFSHYAPNNAVLSVAGPISAGETLDLADKWFATIPRREISGRNYEAEPPITEARRLEVSRQVPQTRIIIAFHTAAYGTKDYRIADIITDILASGNSSRFYRELVMGTDIFTSADASVAGTQEPGSLMITCSLRTNTPDTVRRAEEAVWAQLHRIASEPVTDFELQRALNRSESNRTYSQLNFASKARELAIAVMAGEDINAVAAAYRAITPQDILRVASQMLRPEHSCTLIYSAQE